MNKESLTGSYPYPGEQPDTDRGGQSHQQAKQEPVDDEARRVPHEWQGGTGQLYGDKTLPSQEKPAGN